MSFDSAVFYKALLSALKYAPATIKLTLIVVIAGAILGTISGIIRFYKIPVISQIFTVFTTIYQGIPTMVALVVFNLIYLTNFDSFAKFFHIKTDISDVNIVLVAYIVLILGLSCSVSETSLGALNSIDTLQFEAGYTIGLTKRQTFVRIIFPQIIPVMLPMLTNSTVGTIKGSNLISQIGITEIMVAAITPCVASYRFLEGYIAAALVYWLITIIFEMVLKLLERRSKRFRYDRA